jgi:hypothetical protein
LSGPIHRKQIRVFPTSSPARQFFYPRAHSTLGFGRLTTKPFSRCISMSVPLVFPKSTADLDADGPARARQTPISSASDRYRSNFLNWIVYLGNKIWSCARRRGWIDPLTSGDAWLGSVWTVPSGCERRQFPSRCTGGRGRTDSGWRRRSVPTSKAGPVRRRLVISQSSETDPPIIDSWAIQLRAPWARDTLKMASEIFQTGHFMRYSRFLGRKLDGNPISDRS